MLWMGSPATTLGSSAAPPRRSTTRAQGRALLYAMANEGVDKARPTRASWRRPRPGGPVHRAHQRPCRAGPPRPRHCGRPLGLLRPVVEAAEDVQGELQDAGPRPRRAERSVVRLDGGTATGEQLRLAGVGEAEIRTMRAPRASAWNSPREYRCLLVIGCGCRWWRGRRSWRARRRSRRGRRNWRSRRAQEPAREQGAAGAGARRGAGAGGAAGAGAAVAICFPASEVV